MLDLRLFTIRLGSYAFSPKLIPTVVTLLLLYLLFSLGQWQLSRAQFKDSLRQQIDSRRDLKPVELELLPANNQDKQFVPVKMSGRYQQGVDFLLDNKVMNRQAGYEVVTAFETAEGEWLLVNRGWVAGQRLRSDLPVFTTPKETQQIKGFIRTPYDKVFMLSEQQYDLRQWPVVIQSINIKELAKIIGKDIKPYVVMIDGESPGAFNTEWPAFKLDSDKHIGYAVQWFALFAALVSIYFIVNIKRNKNDE